MNIVASQLTAVFDPAREALQKVSQEFLRNAVAFGEAARSQSVLYRGFLEGLSAVGLGEGSFRTKANKENLSYRATSPDFGATQ